MEIKGCRAPRSCSSQAIVCHIGRSRDAGVDGRGGRAEINFFKLFGKPLLPHYGFHDSAPLECRLPWKPSLGPLLGWMSGLLSLERLWRGERWECFEDGLHFCSAFSRRIFFFLLSALWSRASVGDQLSGCPGSPRDLLAAGTRASQILLAEGTKAAAQAGQQNALSFSLLAAVCRVSPCLQPALIHALLALLELLPIPGAVWRLGKLGELRASAQLHQSEGSRHFVSEFCKDLVHV